MALESPPTWPGPHLKDSVQDGVSSFTRQGRGERANVSSLPHEGHEQRCRVGRMVSVDEREPDIPLRPIRSSIPTSRRSGPPRPRSGNATRTPVFRSPTAIVHGLRQRRHGRQEQQLAHAPRQPRGRDGRRLPDPWVQTTSLQPWVDEHIAVSNVRDDGNRRDHAQDHALSRAQRPSHRGRLFGGVYGENLLEEITEPGEWYLDRTSGILFYVWPPTNFASHDLVASVLSAPLVSVTGASNVVLQELTFEATRTELVQIEGASTNVSVVGCTLRDSGQGAASIADGSNNLFDVETSCTRQARRESTSAAATNSQPDQGE